MIVRYVAHFCCTASVNSIWKCMLWVNQDCHSSVTCSFSMTDHNLGMFPWYAFRPHSRQWGLFPSIVSTQQCFKCRCEHLDRVDLYQITAFKNITWVWLLQLCLLKIVMIQIHMLVCANFLDQIMQDLGSSSEDEEESEAAELSADAVSAQSFWNVYSHCVSRVMITGMSSSW